MADAAAPYRFREEMERDLGAILAYLPKPPHVVTTALSRLAATADASIRSAETPVPAFPTLERLSELVAAHVLAWKQGDATAVRSSESDLRAAAEALHAAAIWAGPARDHERVEISEAGARIFELEQERDRLLEALTLNPVALAAVQEFLEGGAVELADDAIVKLTDAKGRAFTHVTAGWLRRIVELTTDEDGEPIDRRVPPTYEPEVLT